MQLEFFFWFEAQIKNLASFMFGVILLFLQIFHSSRTSFLSNRIWSHFEHFIVESETNQDSYLL